MKTSAIWSDQTTVYQAKLKFRSPMKTESGYKYRGKPPVATHHIAQHYFIPTQYNPVLESQNLLGIVENGSVSDFLFTVAEMIDQNEGETKTALEALLKHVIIYHGGKLYRDLVDENESLSDIPYRLWVFFAHCGDWDSLAVPTYRTMPTETLERFLSEGELKDSYSTGDILKIISKRDDEFGLPVPLLSKIWLN